MAIISIQSSDAEITKTKTGGGAVDRLIDETRLDKPTTRYYQLQLNPLIRNSSGP